MVKWEVYNNSFDSWIVTKNSICPLYNHSKSKVEVELDSSNYATKYDWKSATRVCTLQFAKKNDLANVKSEADETVYLKCHFFFYKLK